MKNRFITNSLSSNMISWTVYMFMFLGIYAVIISSNQPIQTAGTKSRTCLKFTIPSYRANRPEKKIRTKPLEAEKTGPFHPIISKAADRYDVDPDLIRAIIMAESSYNPKAVSKKGAKGLMQLMPQTAKSMGVKDCFNPEHNINGGVRYFKHLLNQFNGNIRLALAAYNAGSRKVRKYGGVPPFRATIFYIKKVSKYYHDYKKGVNQV